jgi:large subunit ribosomal protein L30
MPALSLTTGEYQWRKCLTVSNISDMSKIRVTQIKSKIGQPERQKRILAALGIKKMHQTVEHENTPQIMGMVQKLKHLVKVENV